MRTQSPDRDAITNLLYRVEMFKRSEISAVADKMNVATTPRLDQFIREVLVLTPFTTIGGLRRTMLHFADTEEVDRAMEGTLAIKCSPILRELERLEDSLRFIIRLYELDGIEERQSQLHVAGEPEKLLELRSWLVTLNDTIKSYTSGLATDFSHGAENWKNLALGPKSKTDVRTSRKMLPLDPLMRELNVSLDAVMYLTTLYRLNQS